MLHSSPRPLASTQIPLIFHSQRNCCNLFRQNPHFDMGTKPLSENPSSLRTDANRITDIEAAVSLQEWQDWGTISPIPTVVNQVIEDLKLLEKQSVARMTFNGNHGKLSVRISYFRLYTSG